MTGQEMENYVSDELWNTKISTKIRNWIDLAIQEIADSYIFGELNGRGTVATVAGNPDVTLAADFKWLKTIGIPTQDRKLYPVNESILAESDPQYRTEQGQISRYYLEANNMGLYKVPSAIFTIAYSYQKVPVSITTSLATTYPDLPNPWHRYACQKALTMAYDREGNDASSTKSRAEETRLLIRLQANKYRRPDVNTVMGETGGIGGRPGRPQFPGNYPRVW